jgi:hypothetical protein
VIAAGGGGGGGGGTGELDDGTSGLADQERTGQQDGRERKIQSASRSLAQRAVVQAVRSITMSPEARKPLIFAVDAPFALVREVNGAIMCSMPARITVVLRDILGRESTEPFRRVLRNLLDALSDHVRAILGSELGGGGGGSVSAGGGGGSGGGGTMPIEERAWNAAPAALRSISVYSSQDDLLDLLTLTRSSAEVIMERSFGRNATGSGGSGSSSAGGGGEGGSSGGGGGSRGGGRARK